MEKYLLYQLIRLTDRGEVLYQLIRLTDRGEVLIYQLIRLTTRRRGTYFIS